MLLNTIDALISAQTLTLGSIIRDTFVRELGSQFVIWLQRDEKWCCFNPADLHNNSELIETELVQKLLSEKYDFNRPQVLPIDSGKTLLIVPVRNREALPVAVCGIVSQKHNGSSQNEILAKLVHSLMQQAELFFELEGMRPQIMDSYAHQVTCDFEESTWLRGMASHLEICDLRSDIVNVASNILDPLRELICADSIVLIDNNTVNHPESKLAKSKAIYSSGNNPISFTDSIKLIRAVQSRVGVNPWVRNAEKFGDSIPEMSGVHSCILVRVAKGSFHYGWLLVLNKNLHEQSNAQELISAADASTWEYGTFEAGLANIAGLMIVTHARNMDLFHSQEKLMIGIVRAMINAIDAKDTYTRGHSDRVAAMAKRLAQHLGLNQTECEQIYMCGLLHDIGKIGIPDDILSKPSKLTNEEYDIIKRHPVIGYEILKHLQQLEYVLPGVLHHHEAVDGSGYPHRLTGDQIPLAGRILAVVDAYDAMTSTRPYRLCMAREKAERILNSGAGKQWDAKIVDAFFEILSDMHSICELTDRDLQVAPPTINDMNQSGSNIEETIRMAISTLSPA